jgi:hypothetical protein
MADNYELETGRQIDQQQDGVQDEIELEAQHSLPRPISQSLRARRSSLDRAHTMQLSICEMILTRCPRFAP